MRLTTKMRQKNLKSLPHPSIRIYCIKLPSSGRSGFPRLSCHAHPSRSPLCPRVAHAENFIPASQLFTSHAAESLLPLHSHKLPENFHSGCFWGVKSWQSCNFRFIKWGFHSFPLLGGLFLCLNIIFGWQQDTDSGAPSSLGWSRSTPHRQLP